MTREEKAIEYHDKGFNCCQAVVCSFCEDLGVDEETLFRIGEGFGLGMGCTEGNCGALSGAIMVAGLKNSDGNCQRPTTKGQTYQLSKAIFLAFRDQAGAAVCRQLKGIDSGNVLCSCADCIRIGVRVAEDVLNLSRPEE